MNKFNGWKWATLILVALIILMGCFVVGALFGGSAGFTLGWAVTRQRPAQPQNHGYLEPPHAPERHMPYLLPEEERAWLGVFYDMTDEGAEIMEVIPGSPAEDAELEPGDIILEVDREAVTLATPLDALIARYEPGDRVRLTLLRDGDEEIVRLRLGTRPVQLLEEDTPFFIPPSPGEG